MNGRADPPGAQQGGGGGEKAEGDRGGTPDEKGGRRPGVKAEGKEEIRVSFWKFFQVLEKLRNHRRAEGGGAPTADDRPC